MKFPSKLLNIYKISYQLSNSDYCGPYKRFTRRIGQGIKIRPSLLSLVCQCRQPLSWFTVYVTFLHFPSSDKKGEKDSQKKGNGKTQQKRKHKSPIVSNLISKTKCLHPKDYYRNLCIQDPKSRYKCQNLSICRNSISIQHFFLRVYVTDLKRLIV